MTDTTQYDDIMAELASQRATLNRQEATLTRIEDGVATTNGRVTTLEAGAEERDQRLTHMEADMAELRSGMEATLEACSISPERLAALDNIADMAHAINMIRRAVLWGMPFLSFLIIWQTLL